MAGLTKQRLLEVLFYERESGRFFWKERARDEFSLERCWKSWNVRCAGRQAGCLINGGRKVVVDNEPYFAHQLVWFLERGDWPELIEHRDGRFDDDRIDNLRSLGRSSNSRAAGLSKRSKTGNKGVHRRVLRSGKVRWQAVSWDGEKQKSLGYFATQEEAIAVRQSAEIKLGHRSRPTLFRYAQPGSAKLHSHRGGESG